MDATGPTCRLTYNGITISPVLHESYEQEQQGDRTWHAVRVCGIVRGPDTTVLREALLATGKGLRLQMMNAGLDGAAVVSINTAEVKPQFMMTMASAECSVVLVRLGLECWTKEGQCERTELKLVPFAA